MPKVPFWMFIVLAVLYISAVRVDIMDIDASQYAEISREMMESGSYLQIFDRGRDYLDKPPFLFWVSALGMKIFGVGNLGFKLPSILFALWALFATYRLARSLYDENTGRMAALMLGVCQGMFLMTNDIRTDTILMSWVITAIWMIREADLKRKWYYVLGASACIAFGMMTKGPIAIMAPVFCFGADWALKRQWRKIFDPRHIIYLIIIAIFLIPMSIGLYQQFDMQPEKWMDGKQGTSGLEFFYWTQSFGRITGENVWDNGAGFDFLMVNMLWSFLPWVFLFLPALIINISALLRQRFRLKEDQEWITTGGFILAYIALGSSHYQLPHYIFVAFPLAAIVTAKFLRDLLQDGKYPTMMRIMRPVMVVVPALMFVGVLLILSVTFPAGGLWFAALFLAVAVWVWFTRKSAPAHMLFMPAAMGMILVNVFLTHYFYFELMKFQAGTQVGKFIRAENIPVAQVRILNVNDPLNSLHFYAQGVVGGADTSSLEAAPGDYLLTQEKGLDHLHRSQYQVDTLMHRQLFKVSQLKPAFLNHKIRGSVLSDYYLVQIKSAD